jgi:hypothetical protein
MGHIWEADDVSQIWACGYGGDGALGLGTLENHKYPQQVKTLSDKRIVQVCSLFHQREACFRNTIPRLRLYILAVHWAVTTCLTQYQKC